MRPVLFAVRVAFPTDMGQKNTEGEVYHNQVRELQRAIDSGQVNGR